jgi:hypothetical protein
MAAARTRFELRVETLVGPAALATFRVPLRPTAVPRRTVYRFRIPADRDLTEVIRRLIERDVELLEVRRRPAPPRRPRWPVRSRDDVVVPLRTATGLIPAAPRRLDGTEPADEPGAPG